MSDEMTREQARDTLRNAAWLGSDEERELIEKAVELLCGEPCEDAISRADAEALFRTARSKLNPSDYKTADEFNTRDLMLLNAEQMIHLLPSVTPQEPKASNSENPNKCEDAISRQAAYDLMQSLTRWCVRSEDGKFNNVGLLYDDVMFGIDKLPSVTPKQRAGHWIFDEILDKHYYCSECKSMGVDYWDYCPNCGCAMFEPQERNGV